MSLLKKIIERHKQKLSNANYICHNYILSIDSFLSNISEINESNLFIISPSENNTFSLNYSNLLNELNNSHIRKLKIASNYKELVRKRALLQKQIKIHNERVMDIQKQNEKILIENTCNHYINELDSALFKISEILADKLNFINPDTEAQLQYSFSQLIVNTSPENIQLINSASRLNELKYKQSILAEKLNSFSQLISLHNQQVTALKIENAYNIIGDVEGRKLDKQQMSCIIKETHNHLIIAGAGTGKTTTIVGKIKYVLATGKYKPEDILVLSFTNASANEMKERIHAATGCNIEASTFHKLGLNIISKVNHIVPKITKINLQQFIKEQLKINMQNPPYLKLLCVYLLYNKMTSKNEFDFSTDDEYEEYIRFNPPTTIKHETVKSYGEMDIANFFTENNINYIYEAPYQSDTNTSEYGQYYPDFYLPDYNIYVEYFGIDRNGNVPSYFKSTNNMTASENYRKSMQWKRNLHKENNTVMIECYAYERAEGILLENLKHSLICHSVTLNPKSAGELWDTVSSDEDNILDGIIRLFETLINLIKSNGYTISQFRQIVFNHPNTINNSILLSLIEPIFNSYCSYLNENQEIDFNDMINSATQYIKEQKYTNNYKLVIVDEYQDISKARYSLLKAMRDSNDFDLFCVGDDWQSIYRFAGSDIGYIIHFEKFWGYSEISRIETTYRFSQKLIEISGGFIMKNPVQIKKSIIGKSDGREFPLGEIIGYTDQYATAFMVEKLDVLPKNSTVFLIGRYTFDVNLLKSSDMLIFQYNNISGLVDVKYKKRHDLHISFITAHKSKGLQADYIFIINNKNSRTGFPSKIQDAPILNLLLENSDNYPYSEERRLYYVALTRAKKKVYILTVKGQESEFATELKNKYKKELTDEKYQCPLCGGRMIKKTGPYGEFLGCSNYRTTGCKYKRKIKTYTTKISPS